MSRIEDLKQERNKLLANANKLSKEEIKKVAELEKLIQFEVQNSSKSKPNKG